jgi:hypothetical protein
MNTHDQLLVVIVMSMHCYGSALGQNSVDTHPNEHMMLHMHVFSYLGTSELVTITSKV